MIASRFRAATAADLEILCGMMRDDYAFDHLACNAAAARAALTQLWSRPDWGGAWLVYASDVIAGYVVLGLSFSLEYHGRDAFIANMVLWITNDFC